MSGRGGRGGRGGRWFGRGGGGSVTHDLIRDNLEDLGIDSYNQTGEDYRLPPPLYPSVELPFPTVPTKQSDLFGVEKSRELVHRLHSSEYYLTRNNDKAVPPSQKDALHHPNIDISFRAGINRNVVPAEWQKYVPAELFESKYFATQCCWFPFNVFSLFLQFLFEAKS
jgi:hypothetical protein